MSYPYICNVCCIRTKLIIAIYCDVEITPSTTFSHLVQTLRRLAAVAVRKASQGKVTPHSSDLSGTVKFLTLGGYSVITAVNWTSKIRGAVRGKSESGQLVVDFEIDNPKERAEGVRFAVNSEKGHGLSYLASESSYCIYGC